MGLMGRATFSVPEDTMELNTSTSSTVPGRFPERRSSDLADSHQPTSSHAAPWKRLLRVFTEPERRTRRERRRGRDPLRCEDWSEGKRQTTRRASDRG